MRSNNLICILFISLVLASCAGCLEESKSVPSDANLSVPRANLPEGFTLLAALPEMDPGVNMTDYIVEFSGPQDIGPANNISVGIYRWGVPGDSYDAKIIQIQLSDEEHANGAVSNFKMQEEYQKQLKRGISVFGNATVNSHPVLEIRDIRGDNSIRYLYLWNVGSIVALVEGNHDRSKSLELASATGL